MPLWLMVQVDRWLGGLLVMACAPFAARCRSSPIPILPGFGPNPPARSSANGRDRERRWAAGVAEPRPWSPRVIVVSKFFGMGSVILSVPLLRRLRSKFPAARMLFLSFSSQQKLLTFLPYVDEVRTIRTVPHLFVFDTLRMVWRLRRLGAELYIDLESYSRYTALVSLCSGARVRVGFHTVSLPQRGWLLTHRVYWNPYRHAIDNFLALGGAVGATQGDRSLELRTLTVAEEKKGLAWLRKIDLAPRRYILFAPTSDSVRRLNAYPQDQWLALAELLHRKTGLSLVVIGAKSDPQWGQRRSSERPYLHNLTGRTSFTALLVMVKRAACLVSVDTGIAHLAAVLGVPALTMFGPDTPALYGPVNPRGRIVYANLHCSPCVNLLEGKRSDCRDNVCLTRYSPEDLSEQVQASMLPLAG